MREHIHVLVIDDDEDDFIILRDLLDSIRDQDYDCQWVRTESEAEACLRVGNVDVCLVDYRLGNGAEGTRLIRSLKPTYEVPMIMLTGFGNRALDIESMAAGAEDFIDKAKVDSERLERAIRYAIKNASAVAEVARVNRELDAFADALIRDLHEPLRGLGLTAEVLSDSLSPRLDDQSRAMLQSVMLLSRRIGKLIGELLRYHILERSMVMEVRVDLNEVVKKVLDDLVIQRTRPGTRVELVDELPVVVGDNDGLAEVFRELIANALQYNDKEQKEVQIGMDNGVICVRDNGNGVPAGGEENMFKMFTRYDTRDADDHPGNGLAIARKIVELHGGQISAQSQPEIGTVLHISMRSAD